MKTETKDYEVPMMSIVKSVNVETFEPGYSLKFAIVDTRLGNIVRSTEVSLHSLGSFDQVHPLVQALEKIDPNHLFTIEEIMRLPRSDDPVVAAAETVLKKNIKIDQQLEMTTRESD